MSPSLDPFALFDLWFRSSSSLLTVVPIAPGNGYITTQTLKEILHELDQRLTEEELVGIIEEIDEDGSGTVDFDGEPAADARTGGGGARGDI